MSVRYRFEDLFRRYRARFYRRKYRISGTSQYLQVGSNCMIAPGTMVGDYVYIGPRSMLYPGIEIGSYSMLGPNVTIMGEDHIFNLVGTPIIFSGRPSLPQTRLGMDVWVGAGAFLRCGISIGEGSIIGAGSVVIDDIPEYVIAAGNPCRIIRKRFAGLTDNDDHRVALRAGDFAKVYSNRIEKSILSPGRNTETSIE